MISGRRGAFAAISGGGIWIAHVAVLATRPEGCVGSECGLVSTAPRATEDLAPVFFAAVALIALSIAGLVPRYARGSCRRSLLGASFGLAAAGALALTAGLVLNRLYPDGLDGDLPSLAANDEIRRIVQGVVDEVNRDLARPEQIKRFAVLPRDFAEEKGEITPTL